MSGNTAGTSPFVTPIGNTEARLRFIENWIKNHVDWDALHDSIGRKHSYKYDASGNISTYILWEDSTRLAPKLQIDYTYNASGLLSKETETRYILGKKAWYRSFEYTYDVTGKLLDVDESRGNAF